MKFGCHIFSCMLFIFLMNISANAASDLNLQYINEENANVALYEQVNPAIVSIDANIQVGQSSGTGFIIDTKGIIVTSSHVVDNAEEVDVTTFSGQVYKGKVISAAKENQDLALVKIEPKERLAALKLADFDKIKVGQKVVAIGNPFGFRGTMTVGIVSRIDYTKNKIQTDAAINPGSSGGPLINGKGEVIGISQSIYNPDNDQSNIGIGFAVPVNEVKKFLSLAKSDKKF